jgi:branched-chain amino acid transport system permease protein
MSTYEAGLLAQMGIALLQALSVYVILATGQLSLGNAGFMAIGAYACSALTVMAGVPLPLALFAAALLCGVIGIGVGFPALRLRGIYLAMATLGFGEITRSFFLNFTPTGGAQGFHGMAPTTPGMIWLYAAGALILVLAIERSRLWLEFRAIDDDEVASALIGLNTTSVKVGAFGLGAALAGIAGGLFAHFSLYIEPGNFGFEKSIEMVLYVVLGGSTTAFGSLFGAVVLTLLPEFLRFMADWRLATYGALLILVLLFRRQGILDRHLLASIARLGRPRAYGG